MSIGSHCARSIDCSQFKQRPILVIYCIVLTLLKACVNVVYLKERFPYKLQARRRQLHSTSCFVFGKDLSTSTDRARHTSCKISIFIMQALIARFDVDLEQYTS